VIGIKQIAASAGLPRIIIALFLTLLFISAPFVDVRVDTSLSDTVVRFGMNAVMVLALIPMIQSGCGLNFGLPLGIIAGLLGAIISIELQLKGLPGVFGAMLISLPISATFGYIYGKILNKVKGDEMMIATYVGFSSVMLMCIMWLIMPFKNPTMIWGFSGKGLRTTISTEGYWLNSLSNFLSFRIGKNFYFPTGMFIFFIIICVFIWLFFKTKTGTAVTAAGSNPVFARASGIDINKMRVISVVLSTVIGGFGIIVYQQSFGFIQLYTAPLWMAFPAVASVLIGGASVNKASILNVVIGTFLFQGILTMTPSVINSVLKSDMSEIIRILVTSGMILYALTRRQR